MGEPRDNSLKSIDAEVERCRRCPRLVEHREWVSLKKRRAYLQWQYWGRPVAGFGDPFARLLLVGLAPAAHGANRTGRMFTGDSSGDLLYATLARFGFCNQARSVDRDDGLKLRETYITAAARCAPPSNRPTAGELAACRGFLKRELLLLDQLRVVVALGKIAWDSYLTARSELGRLLPSPRPRFGHSVFVPLEEKTTLVGCYHPSRQNTQTGRLTRDMFESVFEQVRQLLG
jgi:uracil-DNA glycosylase family 4